jgi:hypothetical protein
MHESSCREPAPIHSLTDCIACVAIGADGRGANTAGTETPPEASEWLSPQDFIDRVKQLLTDRKPPSLKSLLGTLPLAASARNTRAASADDKGGRRRVEAGLDDQRAERKPGNANCMKDRRRLLPPNLQALVPAALRAQAPEEVEALLAMLADPRGVQVGAGPSQMPSCRSVV